MSNQEDDQLHILECQSLNGQNKDLSIYENLLSDDINEEGLRRYIKMWKKRDEIMGQQEQQ